MEKKLKNYITIYRDGSRLPQSNEVAIWTVQYEEMRILVPVTHDQNINTLETRIGKVPLCVTKIAESIYLAQELYLFCNEAVDAIQFVDKWETKRLFDRKLREYDSQIGFKFL